jgi:hypothetical protein
MTNRRNVVALAALAALIGSGSRAQSLSSVQLQAVQTIRDLEQLKPGTPEAIALVSGFHRPGDDGGGIFVWRRDAVEQPDGALVLGSSAGQGRWFRIHEGTLNVRMFGAVGDGKADDTAAIQAAIDAAAGQVVRIPAGTWRITKTLRFRSARGRHSAGLKLVGEGPNVTMIDSQVADGPAIHIEQGESYKFGTHGLLQDFDLIGENAPRGRNQHGIVLSGAWLYRLDRVVVRSFRGSGLLVPFVPDRGVRYSDVELVAGSNLARRPAGHLNDSLNNDEVIEGDGIAADTVVKGLIDEKTLIMSRPALRSGRVELNIWGKNPDGQTSILTLQDCRIIWNIGWGIYSDVAVGLMLNLRETQIGNNNGGGLRSGGYVDMHGGTVTSNGTDDGKGPGILIEGPGRSPADLVRIEAVEIDGNREYNLWLRRARFARVTRCRFNATELENVGRQFPLAAIRLGDSDGSGVHTVEFSQNMIRAGGLHNWPHVGFEIPDGAAIENVVARDTMFWGGWSDAHHTRYRIGQVANPAARIVFEEDGRPASGQVVPAAYFVQLRADVTPEVVSGGAAIVLRFVSLSSTPGRNIRTWSMQRIPLVDIPEGGSLGRVASPLAQAVAKGTPVLLFGEQMRLNTIVEATGSTLTFAQVDARPWSGPAYTGGILLPYDGHYAVEVASDVVGNGSVQPLNITLLASGKPVHVEKTALLGLAGPQTLRLSWAGRWPAGTALHVVLRNDSSAAVSLGGATMTVRLLL